MKHIEVDYNTNHEAIPSYDKETPAQIAHKKNMFIHLAKAICEQINFDTHLDFGCGSGYLVNAMRIQRKKSFGVEVGYMLKHGLFPEVSEFISERSILDEDPTCQQYDLVSAMEVLEHLYAENFQRNDLNKGIANLINTSSKYIFLTMPILTPDYCPWLDWGGRDPAVWPRLLRKDEVPLNADGTPILGHVTLATEAWWRCKLESFGLREMPDEEDSINAYLISVDPGLLEWWHIFLYQI